MIKLTDDMVNIIRMYETRFKISFPMSNIPSSESNEGLARNIMSCLRSNNADIGRLYTTKRTANVNTKPNSNQSWDDDDEEPSKTNSSNTYTVLPKVGSALDRIHAGNSKYRTHKNIIMTVGGIVAACLSWGVNKSIFWALISYFFNWFYVLYNIIRYHF